MTIDATSDEIVTAITSVIETFFEIPASDIALDADWRDDLDLDSIDVVEIIVHLQDQFRVVIEPDALEEVRTVANLRDVVAHLLAADSSKGP